MKLIVNNNDIYDIGHDDTINEYIIYLCTNDYVITKAWDKIYGENVLDDTIEIIQKSHPIDVLTVLDLGESVEDYIDGKKG